MSTTILNHVSWQTYECLLRDYESSSSPRFTYDRGVLEIMSPLIPHEETNRAIAKIVETILEEWAMEYDNLGSTTFKRPDMERGIEPDTCFYIQNVGNLTGKRSPDLIAGDLPPDLVIEMDVTHDSLDKLPLYAAFGVTEVWRVTVDGITILGLAGESYTERDASIALPPLTHAALSNLLQQRAVLSRLNWVNAIREWAQNNVPGS
jgi:Uma2 family endonuclease